MRGTCPALNANGVPCRMPGVRSSGWYCYHDPINPILPAANRLPSRSNGRLRLPSLRRLLTLDTLRQWAAEFDVLGQGRYTASEFVEWLELEAAPPAPPLKDDGAPVYPVVGRVALVRRAHLIRQRDRPDRPGSHVGLS
jgi:hypothetical protein